MIFLVSKLLLGAGAQKNLGAGDQKILNVMQRPNGYLKQPQNSVQELQ